VNVKKDKFATIRHNYEETVARHKIVRNDGRIVGIEKAQRVLYLFSNLIHGVFLFSYFVYVGLCNNNNDIIGSCPNSLK